MADIPDWSETPVATADLCTALTSLRPLPATIRPLFAGISIFGKAITVQIPPGQNRAVHRAVHTARPGDVLVIDAEGDRLHGVFGDLLAACCQNKGIAGAVVNGCIRDSRELVRMRFPVFCLGRSPAPAGKSGKGTVGDDLWLDGVQIRSGDFVVGDDDGIVVVPAESAKEAFSRARAVTEQESVVRRRLAAGETTLEILNLH